MKIKTDCIKSPVFQLESQTLCKSGSRETHQNNRTDYYSDEESGKIVDDGGDGRYLKSGG